MSKIIAMAPKGNHRGKRMWPSLETANQIGSWANIFLVCSLVVGAASTVAIVWTTGIKEAYWDKDRLDSAEKIAALTKQGEQLRKDTAEAELALAKLKAPRGLTPQQYPVLRDKMAKFSGLTVRIWSLSGSADIFALSTSFQNLFTQAGWKAGTATSLSGKSLPGILVGVWKGSNGGTAAEQFVEYLNSVGISTGLDSAIENDGGLMPAANMSFPPGNPDMIIVIGSKL